MRFADVPSVYRRGVETSAGLAPHALYTATRAGRVGVCAAGSRGSSAFDRGFA
jgi:hypothetical protein